MNKLLKWAKAGIISLLVATTINVLDLHIVAYSLTALRLLDTDFT
ncbi:hypothetical protein [Glaciecola sp. HTCC2999]|nr:hypothetical protein [Glaciecola sp. HTCC2999]